MSFGQRLKEARLKKELSQEALGKIVNVPRETISKYELDERTPLLHVAVNLAYALNVSLLYIAELTNHEYLDLTNLDKQTRSAIEFILLKNMKKESKRK